MLINPLGIKDEESVAFCIHITMNKKKKNKILLHNFGEYIFINFSWLINIFAK